MNFPRPIICASEFRPFGRPRGFTLIELLVVISIIALLATLAVGVGPYVSKKMKLNRVEGEMAQLEAAIESYKSDFGNYPPDHVINRNPTIVNARNNPLFYELTGTIYNPQENRFYVPADNDNNTGLSPDEIKQWFGRGGFVNSVDEGSEQRAGNYLPNLNTSQYAEVNQNPDIELLVINIPGPNGRPNPWRYVSTQPTNNPATFDLWAEVVIGGETNVVGNWQN